MLLSRPAKPKERKNLKARHLILGRIMKSTDIICLEKERPREVFSPFASLKEQQGRQVAGAAHQTGPELVIGSYTEQI